MARLAGIEPAAHGLEVACVSASPYPLVRNGTSTCALYGISISGRTYNDTVYAWFVTIR
jgi:hypothetical protein